MRGSFGEPDALPPGAARGVPRLVAEAARAHSGRIQAVLISLCGGDFQLAEDALQEALAAALERWPEAGIPATPEAWILTTAKRRAIDRLRRDQRLASKQEQLTYLLAQEPAGALDIDDAADAIEDDRLRLIFTCCHPALSMESQVALTLRTIAGLDVPEIAHAFLVAPDTMAKRLTRARTKIRDARIPYRVPADHELAERLNGVLAVIYLIFNEGYLSATSTKLTRLDLCDEAIRLGRLLASLMPDVPDLLGLLALMLLNHARRAARTDAEGDLVTIEHQDRSLWDRSQIDEGLSLLERGLRLRRPGPFQVQAAIAALHVEPAEPEQTDWAQIVALYDQLISLQPSPVIALNRAAAIGMAYGPEPALRLLDELRGESDLARYHLLPAARAELLRRAGRLAEAVQEYQKAIALCSNTVERRYLERRLEQSECSEERAP